MSDLVGNTLRHISQKRATKDMIAKTSFILTEVYQILNNMIKVISLYYNTVTTPIIIR
jgi:hypothetical protein